MLLFISTHVCRLNFSLPLSQLPLETRVCFTIHGNESLTRKPIGWVAMPIFNLNRYICALCHNVYIVCPHHPLYVDTYRPENITCVCGHQLKELILLVHVMVMCLILKQ